MSSFYFRNLLQPVLIGNVCRWCLHTDKQSLLQVILPRTYFLKDVRSFLSKSLGCTFLVNCRYMAGHSKWQNIKHIKAEKDRLKTNVCNKYLRLVGIAVREQGPDPKLNSKLASLLDEARRNNVPLSTLESALKKASNKKLKPGMIEILGPGGCFIIIEYETDNISTTRHDIKVICKKYGVNIFSGDGRWRSVYNQKGIVKATALLNGEPLDAEKALDAAIEAGAEEVQKIDDEEEKAFLEFLCAPDDLHTVKKQLEKQYEIEEAYVGFIPFANVKLSENDMLTADNFLSEMDNMSEIVRIYENIQ